MSLAVGYVLQATAEVAGGDGAAPRRGRGGAPPASVGSRCCGCSATTDIGIGDPAVICSAITAAWELQC